MYRFRNFREPAEIVDRVTTLNSRGNSKSSPVPKQLTMKSPRDKVSTMLQHCDLLER